MSLMQRIEKHFLELVLPSLVPLYASNHRNLENPDQVGTGMLFDIDSRPMLITAKHSLFGHDGNQNAGEVAFHNNGGWVYVGDCESEVFCVANRDIACFHVDTLEGRRCLSLDNIQTSQPCAITIGGYLSRDFKREGDTLRPKPYIFTDSAVSVGDDLLGLRFQRSKVTSNANHMRQFAPIPRGLSGGPMLDSAQLAKGNVSLVGVFTEQSDGTARGEPSIYVQGLLGQLARA